MTPEEKHPETPGDPWTSLTRYTSARIALGRAGGSVRTRSLLDFRISHARARDAVAMEFDASAVETALHDCGLQTYRVETAATERKSFLLRPDLGRELSSDSRGKLLEASSAWGRRDLVIIVSDGLSALAAMRQAVPTVSALYPLLSGSGWSMFPVVTAPFGRVKLQDQIGEILGARHALMFLGERPGLGSPDSLGAYFTFGPRADRSDADRNCISNIRPEGLPPAQAAEKIVQLLRESVRLGLSGVGLKDTGPTLSATGGG